MYDITQVCLRLTMTSWSLNEERAEVRLFMKRNAPITAMISGNSHINPAFCR